MLGEKKKAQRRLKGPESRASEVEKAGLFAKRSRHFSRKK